MQMITVVAISLAAYGVGLAASPLVPAPDRKPTEVAASELLAKLDSGQVARLDVYVSPRRAVVIDKAGHKFTAAETPDTELALFRHARPFNTPIAVHSEPSLTARLIGTLVSRTS